MFKKFTEGLVFGGGFGISFILLWYIAAYLIYPIFVTPHIQDSVSKQISELESQMSPSMSSRYEMPDKPRIQFHELSLEEQIKTASVIAIAKYEKSSDGKMKAIIKEFLKKEPGATIYYNIGDEYPGSSYYPKENTMYGDGVVIFFTGSPASMRMSMSYSGNRIHSLGDIPIELFKKKCEEPNA
jgi:hypothetical protein